MKLLAWFFLFSLLTSSVAAIGISPPLVRLDYQEGEVYDFEFKIINNAASDRVVNMSSKPPFDQYLEFSEDSFQFKPQQSIHTINVRLTMPPYDEIELFGKQKFYIRAREEPPKGDGIFVITTSVEGYIIVDIPVPGKFAEIGEMKVNSVTEGSDLPVSVLLRNRGTQALSATSLELTVYDYEQNVIDEYSYDNIAIAVDGEYRVEETLPTADYPPSKYYIEAHYTFDEERSPDFASEEFFIGTTDIILTDYTKRVTADKINRINLTLQSLWGSPLKNIRGSIISDFAQQPLQVIDFDSFEQRQLQVFLDVPATNESTINAVLSLDIPVDENTRESKEIPLTFEIKQVTDARSESPLGGSSLAIIAVVAIILLLVGLNVAILSKKKSSEKKGHKKK